MQQRSRGRRYPSAAIGTEPNAAASPAGPARDAQRVRRGRRWALALTWLRLALAPVLILVGWGRGRGWVAATLLMAGFLSDVFDGVIARSHGASSEVLRRLDSIVDTLFYLAVAYCTWRLYPDELRPYLLPIGILVCTEVLNYAVAIARLGREASYHAGSARLFGLLLFASLITLLVSGSAALLPVAIVAGFVSHAENLAITFLLPEWKHDVPSLVHAWRLRAAARCGTTGNAA